MDHEQEAKATKKAAEILGRQLLANGNINRREFTRYLREFADNIDRQTDADYLGGSCGKSHEKFAQDSIV